ncbi:MAG: hypothetical protein GX330_04370 [Bacteroidales bacterium]|nr:hypothetical protein [Bacteroidales bacterium]
MRVIFSIFFVFVLTVSCYCQATKEFWEHSEWIKIQKLIKKGDTIKVQKQFDIVFDHFSDTLYIYKNAFIEAVKNSDLIMMSFIERQSILSNHEFDNDLPFSVACRRCSKKIIEYFLDKGCSLYKIDSDINYLYILFNEREYSICEWAMQDFKSDINMKYGDLQRTLLHNVVLSKHSVKKVKLLLNFGIDKNIIDSQGQTAFDYVEQYEKNIFKKKKLKKLLK